MTKRVDLDHEAERDTIPFTKLNQPIEGRFPFFIACKIIVSDKKFSNPLRPIQAHEVLDIVRRTVARFATLHIDDGAKRALIRATAASVKTGARAERTLDVSLRKERHRGALHCRQVLHVVVYRREPSGGRIGNYRFEPPLGFAGEHGDTDIPASVEIDRAAIQH